MSVAWQRKRGRLIVPPIQSKGRAVHMRETSMATSLEICDAIGNQDSYVRWAPTPRMQSESWWNPNHWTFHRKRVDAHGAEWSAMGGTFVMDDFGFLVEVPR